MFLPLKETEALQFDVPGSFSGKKGFVEDYMRRAEPDVGHCRKSSLESRGYLTRGSQSGKAQVGMPWAAFDRKSELVRHSPERGDERVEACCRLERKIDGADSRCPGRGKEFEPGAAQERRPGQSESGKFAPELHQHA